MSQLTIQPTAITTMTSREIGELTGKGNGHVMRDIRKLQDDLSMNPELDSCIKSTTYTGSDGREYDQYELDKDTCLTLLLGYDAVARMKVVKRWQELETQAAIIQPVKTIRQAARETMTDIMEESALFEIPKHLAQIEATKEVLKLHGVDFSPYLKIAPAQQNILREEESLEPTDLGKTIGYTGKDFNLLLVSSGMQVKTVEGWFPTEEGKPYATVHSWAKGAKSGYNLKWRRSVLKQLDL